MTASASAYLRPLSDLTQGDTPGRLQALVDFLGYRPNALLTMARRPALLPAVLELVQVALRGPGRLGEGLRFLVACEASRVAGCGYSAAHAAHAALHLDMPLSKLVELDRQATSSQYTPRERAALSLASVASSALGADAHARRDAAFKDARACFDEEELVELVTVISAFGWFNRWNSLVRSELEAEPATVVAELPWLAALQMSQRPASFDP
jgi:alkylhydroperoxidase family enzyme